MIIFLLQCGYAALAFYEHSRAVILARTVCRWRGHYPWTDDGYMICYRCVQSLDFHTGEALGWLGINYHPDGAE